MKVNPSLHQVQVALDNHKLKWIPGYEGSYAYDTSFRVYYFYENYRVTTKSTVTSSSNLVWELSKDGTKKRVSSDDIRALATQEHDKSATIAVNEPTFIAITPTNNVLTVTGRERVDQIALEHAKLRREPVRIFELVEILSPEVHVNRINKK